MALFGTRVSGDFLGSGHRQASIRQALKTPWPWRYAAWHPTRRALPVPAATCCVTLAWTGCHPALSLTGWWTSLIGEPYSLWCRRPREWCPPCRGARLRREKTLCLVQPGLTGAFCVASEPPKLHTHPLAGLTVKCIRRTPGVPWRTGSTCLTVRIINSLVRHEPWSLSVNIMFKWISLKELKAWVIMFNSF